MARVFHMRRDVLLGGNALFRCALSKPVEDHMLDYVRTIQSFLSEEIGNAARAYGYMLCS